MNKQPKPKYRIHSARGSESSQSEISKNIIRSKSRRKLLLQKKHTSSSKNLTAGVTNCDNSAHNGSQPSMIKIKRPPLNNFTLMRSQSNLSLYSTAINNGGSNTNTNSLIDDCAKLSSLTKFKSPDLSLKSGKIKKLKLETRSIQKQKQQSFCVSEVGKENIPQNSSMMGGYRQEINEMSYVSNHNHHVVTGCGANVQKGKNRDLKHVTNL